MNRLGCVILISALATSTGAVHAQWFNLQDAPEISGTVCAVVNAENVRFVISDAGSNLILVNGNDRLLTNTVVTETSTVLIDGEETGFIEFATDQTGRRRVFWVTGIGTLYRLDAEGNPIATETFTDEAVGDCDPCESLWDIGDDCVPDPVDEAVSDTGQALTSALCGTGAASGLSLAAVASFALRRRRLRVLGR